MQELWEIADGDPGELARTLEADGRAENDPTKVEEARLLRLEAKRQRALSSDKGDKLPHEIQTDPSGAKTPEKAAQRATSTKPKAKPKRKRSATEKALSDAAREPDRMLAGSIRSAASLGWTVAGAIVTLVFVYLVVTKGARVAGGIRDIETIVRSVVYPPAVFPERAQAASRGNGSGGSGGKKKSSPSPSPWRDAPGRDGWQQQTNPDGSVTTVPKV
jgi:hypothetical protein